MKSFWEFVLGEEEEEEEEAWRVNRFLEGIDFLDAIVRKLKGDEGKEEHSRRHSSRKKEKKSAMHDNT